MKILLATDGSEFSTAAVDECKKYIESGMATEIKIVSLYEAQIPIVAEPMAMASDCYQKLNDFARERASDAAQGAREMLLEAETERVVEITIETEMENPSSYIPKAAKAWGADMIIVGSHGRGFLGRIALGSVSDAVVHSAPCSVLVVRSK
jgi:nucleotide-binding universal stress UspA family protein